MRRFWEDLKRSHSSLWPVWVTGLILALCCCAILFWAMGLKDVAIWLAFAASGVFGSGMVWSMRKDWRNIVPDENGKLKNGKG